MSLEQPNIESRVAVLTGSIGSGKSTVARMLEELGAVVISADALAREVVEPGSPGLEQIRQIFGESVILPTGQLDRRRLAEAVFHDPDKKERLESIAHPLIRSLAAERFANALAASPPLVVYDCPLYFETGLDRSGFRCAITVLTDEEQCIERVQRRDGITEEDVRARLAYQLPGVEKARRSDYVIENNGTLDELSAKVRALFAQLAENR